MRKKSVLAFMMAMAMMAGVAAPAITSQAAGLTQAQDASAVQYGSLTAEETKLLESMFDYEYYKAQNSDLVAVLGDDPAKLFEHFCKCGIFEGRTCNANFDPAAYASAYTDLKASFGTNIFKYYEHFAKFAVAENRTISTVAACAKAGITVQGIVGEDVKISPAAYMLAEKLGTTDYATVQQAVSQAVSEEATNKSNGNASTSSSVVATKTEIDSIVAKAQGLELVGKVSVKSAESAGKSLYLYVVKTDSAYGVYEQNTSQEAYTSGNRIVITNTGNNLKDFTPLYTTEGYDIENASNVEVVCDLYVYAPLSLDNPYKVTNTTEVTYDPTGRPVYEDVVKEGTKATTGNKLQVFEHNGYSPNNSDVSYETVEKEIKSTNTYEATSTLVGYYADKDATVEKFSNEQEKQVKKAEWDSKNIPYFDEDDYTLYQDPKGNPSTTYDVGVKIAEKDNGVVEVTLGISNKDDNFGYVATYDIERKTTAE